MRRGRDYKKSLSDGRSVWVSGREVGNVAEHRDFAPVIETVAGLIDLHHDKSAAKLLTDTDSTGRFPACLRPAQTASDLKRLGAIADLLATRTLGQMARLYDFTAAYVNGLYENRHGLSGLQTRKSGEPVATVIADMHERFKRGFLQGTIAFSEPYGAKLPGASSQALRITKRSRKGITVSGVKTLATGAAYADEILVLTL
ncbi:MAG: 4-hydroxyphenylacetate 3-hydroxylase N-terminal domain-containing protein, partial [Bdellovibrionia bacterium]